MYARRIGSKLNGINEGFNAPAPRLDNAFTIETLTNSQQMC